MQHAIQLLGAIRIYIVRVDRGRNGHDVVVHSLP